MRLTDDEKSMLDGRRGPARRKAMELLVKYGEALGAERLVDTNNVCGTMGASTPFIREWAVRTVCPDPAFCEFNLDTEEVFEIPKVDVFACHLIQGIDPDHWELQGIGREVYEASMRGQEFCARIGVQLMNTCAPYLVGNVPAKGEHCAWMESSAVIYCNSVLGARTNAEGRESAGAAMLTGKIPYWGYHLDENRFGTHLIQVQCDVRSPLDWGLLGYFTGQMVGGAGARHPRDQGCAEPDRVEALRRSGRIFRRRRDGSHRGGHTGSTDPGSGFRGQETREYPEIRG